MEIMEEEQYKTNFFVVEADGINDFYKDILAGILEKGKDVSPRGLPTKEVRPAMIILTSPRERFLTCPGRLIHPFFQVMESLWILGGRGDLEFIEYYLGNMKKYADGLDEFHAPYGTRMRSWNEHRSKDLWPNKFRRDQFADCYHALKKDPDTRQAIFIFWNPVFDNYQRETNDRPCNVSFQFLIRDGKLDLTIFNRSNDLNLGLCNANVVQFSVILETMALLLGIPVGNQIHMINSLHIYNYQGEITRRGLDSKYDFNVYDYVKPNPFTMDFPETAYDLVPCLDIELKLFFEAEDQIRKGNLRYSVPVTFNYLIDALTIAKSFYHYKHKEYEEAVSELNDLQADDIFITSAEFLARKVEFEYVKHFVLDKFEERMSKESLEKILEYIERH